MVSKNRVRPYQEKNHRIERICAIFRDVTIECVAEHNNGKITSAQMTGIDWRGFGPYPVEGVKGAIVRGGEFDRVFHTEHLQQELMAKFAAALKENEIEPEAAAKYLNKAGINGLGNRLKKHRSPEACPAA